MRIWILLACLLLFVSTAYAHKVNIFAYVEGGQIFSESYFPDGRPVIGGKVFLYDQAGTLLVKGETDNKGYWNTGIPKVEDLKLEIKASMGHKNSYRLLKSEIEAGR